MKTEEELNTIKEEIEVPDKKLTELNEEELTQLNSGLLGRPPKPKNPCGLKNKCNDPCPFPDIIRKKRDCDGCIRPGSPWLNI